MAGHSKWANIQRRKGRRDALRDKIAGASGNATAEVGGGQRTAVRFEGHAPGGVAVIVDSATDNKARTESDVRVTFAKFGGSLGADGCVAFMFKPVGVLVFAPGADEVKLAEVAIAAGADDVVREPSDGAVDVLTSLEAFASVRSALEQAGMQPDHAELTMRADIDVGVSGDAARRVVQLIESLEDLDDVQHVYTNAELSADAGT